MVGWKVRGGRLRLLPRDQKTKTKTKTRRPGACWKDKNNLPVASTKILYSCAIITSIGVGGR